MIKSIALIAGILLVVPGATANHWLLYTNDVDGSHADTLEDDAAVMQMGGDELVGRVNRVTTPGNVPGDGTLFLDARVGGSLAGTTIYADPATESAFGRRDTLPAGSHDVAAWYGYWRDIDNDGVIDDARAGDCGGTCPDDEFLWRGLASQESIAMVALVAPRGTLLPAPSYYGTFIFGIGFGGFGFYAHAPGDADRYRAYAMTDHTAIDDAHQGWFGTGEFTFDGGFLSTVETLVFAGAPKSTGAGVGYDLDHSRALYDVDTYTGVSPDVEAFWTLASRQVYRDVGAATENVNASVSDMNRVAGEIFNGIVPNELPPVTLEDVRIVLDEVDAVLDVANTMEPDAMKEPTHELDDFEGRATWGGHAFSGASNGYSGYAGSHHLWFDTIMFHDTCAGVYANTGAAVVAESAGCWDLTAVEPWALNTEPASRETSYLSFGFWSSVHLWNDINGDGYFNDACDPSDPEEFDSATNLCRDPESEFFRRPTEVVGACDVSTAKGGVLTLMPVGGPWPGVIVVRDAEQTTRVLTDDHWEVRGDDQAIELRWGNECREDFYGNRAELAGRDTLLFPTLFPDIGVLVRAEATIEGFTDTSLGIEIGAERVVDYDYYPPAL